MSLRNPLSRRRFTTALALFAWSSAALPSTARAEPPQELFVIARSLNANEVHYAARCTNGVFDRRQPMHAHWVMNAEDGRREELSWLERHFAYGWDVVSRVEAQRFELQLIAFPDRRVVVRVDAAGRARAEVRIQGRAAVLRRIFVQLAQGAALAVRQIELSGVEIASGRAVRELIRPE